MTPPSTLNWPEVYRAIWVRFRGELPFSYPAVAVMSAAAAGSTLTTVGKVDRLGGKLAFCSAEMTDETGKVIVRAHCVMCFTGRALPL